MSTEQQVTDTFVYPCRTCGGTVQVTASMTQPHDCQPPDSTESLAARAWWAGHDHAAAEVERLRAENERISGAWGEVIQREQRQDNAHLFDMNALRAERDALAARLQTVRELLDEAERRWAGVPAVISVDEVRSLLDASLGAPGDEKPQPNMSGICVCGHVAGTHHESYPACHCGCGGYCDSSIGSPGDETATARLCDERGMTEYRRPGNPYPCTGSMHVGPDEVVRCDNPIHFAVSPVESSGSAE